MSLNDTNADSSTKDQGFDEIFAAAKALTKSDWKGARGVLADAVIAEMDPLAIDALISDIKASTGISVNGARKQYDKMAGARKKGPAEADRAVPFAVYEPAAQPRSLADVLDEIADMFRARVSCTEDDITVATLWSAGTWGVQEGTLPGQEAQAALGPHIYPRLRVNSGAPNSGKTTLLETISYVARHAVSADGITASSFFRLVDQCQPTLVLDEADTWVNGNEGIRKVINSGHRRAGIIIISAKDAGQDDADWEPTPYRTFAPVALAGLGSLAATIESRSIQITLTKSPSFHGKRVTEPDLVAFRDRIAPHLAAHGDKMASAMARGAPGRMPPGLINRAADNWEPLLVVARLAGRKWLERAFRACINLGAQPKKATTLGKPEHLLSDLYAYHRALVQARWDRRRAGREAKGKGRELPPNIISNFPGIDAPSELLSTSGFIEWLSTTPGYASPWAEGIRRDAHGRVIGGPTPHAIARVMRSFKVHPARLDNWSRASGRNEPVRGYLVSELRSLWRTHDSVKGIG